MVRFGHYHLLRRIAVGGMAEIFLCRSASIDGFERILIIKKMRPELSRDPRFYSLFINEARIASALLHPNTVLVVDYGKLEDSYYIAMEYVGGCDLDDLLSLGKVAKRGLDPGLALYIAREVCHGLAHAHDLADSDGSPFGIVHRDISPENILVSYRGQVKITDFGIATSNVAATDKNLGKLPYLAPEQVRERDTDRRTDIYALGLVLWELLVGRRACGEKVTRKKLLALHKTGIPKPSKSNPWLSLDLDLLVDGALAIDPELRYPSARRFADAITGVLERDFPNTDGRALCRFLETNRSELDEIQRRRRLDADQRPMGPEAQALVEKNQRERRRLGETVADPRWSPALNQALARFEEQPSLWTMVEMGHLVEQEGDKRGALCFYRGAALKFAQAGLFAQAMRCAKTMLAVEPTTELYHEIAQLVDLRGAGDYKIEAKLKLSGSPYADLLVRLMDSGGASAGLELPPTPLLSDLSGKVFADLVVAAPMRLYRPGENIVAEGEGGTTMYLIGEGRVLIFATAADGQRVYLSALRAGDFFGENSFFTGAKRSATVQAVSEVRVFEIAREHFDRLMKGNERAKEILLRFYRQRIVDNLLAKSPTFGLLRREDRQALADRLSVRIFAPGDLIIEEGTRSRHIFLIKEGTAEVFTQKQGEHTTLSEIGPGTIFGEVAALRNVARTASVKAKTRLEALAFDGSVFLQLLEAQPEVKARILELGAKRARANIDKLSLFSPGRKTDP